MIYSKQFRKPCIFDICRILSIFVIFIFSPNLVYAGAIPQTERLEHSRKTLAVIHGIDGKNVSFTSYYRPAILSSAFSDSLVELKKSKRCFAVDEKLNVIEIGNLKFLRALPKDVPVDFSGEIKGKKHLLQKGDFIVSRDTAEQVPKNREKYNELKATVKKGIKQKSYTKSANYYIAAGDNLKIDNRIYYLRAEHDKWHQTCFKAIENYLIARSLVKEGSLLWQESQYKIADTFFEELKPSHAFTGNLRDIFNARFEYLKLKSCEGAWKKRAFFNLSILYSNSIWKTENCLMARYLEHAGELKGLFLQYPKLLLSGLKTDSILYTGFGEFDIKLYALQILHQIEGYRNDVQIYDLNGYLFDNMLGNLTGSYAIENQRKIIDRTISSSIQGNKPPETIIKQTRGSEGSGASKKVGGIYLTWLYKTGGEKRLLPHPLYYEVVPDLESQNKIKADGEKAGKTDQISIWNIPDSTLGKIEEYPNILRYMLSDYYYQIGRYFLKEYTEQDQKIQTVTSPEDYYEEEPNEEKPEKPAFVEGQREKAESALLFAEIGSRIGFDIYDIQIEMGKLVASLENDINAQEKAIDYFKKAIAIDEWLLSAYAQIGEYCYELRDFDKKYISTGKTFVERGLVQLEGLEERRGDCQTCQKGKDSGIYKFLMELKSKLDSIGKVDKSEEEQKTESLPAAT
ncbi:MAG: hypothetical protein KKE31_02950 [Planctomycetes bacterium]|nr:hypothetical protein [Planctomycetota bacterium]